VDAFRTFFLTPGMAGKVLFADIKQLAAFSGLAA
jgi:hypothetical protein